MAYLGNSPLNRLYSTRAVPLSQGQTVVVVSYTPGMVLFFKNGALLHQGADYTATDGSTVTLVNPASDGDVLVGINLAQFAVSAVAGESNAGMIKIATTLLAQGLADDETALSPKKLADAFGGGNQSLTTEGYQKLPGGLIWQWGFQANVNDDIDVRTVVLPVAFPVEILSLSASVDNPTGGSGTYTSNAAAFKDGASLSTIKVMVSTGTPAVTKNVWWQVIGK